MKHESETSLVKIELPFSMFLTQDQEGEICHVLLVTVDPLVILMGTDRGNGLMTFHSFHLELAKS